MSVCSLLGKDSHARRALEPSTSAKADNMSVGHLGTGLEFLSSQPLTEATERKPCGVANSHKTELGRVSVNTDLTQDLSLNGVIMSSLLTMFLAGDLHLSAGL